MPARSAHVVRTDEGKMEQAVWPLYAITTWSRREPEYTRVMPDKSAVAGAFTWADENGYFARTYGLDVGAGRWVEITNNCDLD